MTTQIYEANRDKHVDNPVTIWKQSCNKGDIQCNYKQVIFDILKLLP